MNEDFKRKLSEMEDLDESIIREKPWAQHLLASSLSAVRKTVLNWCNVVMKVGESELDLDRYVAIFGEQLSSLCEELVTDMDAVHEKSLDRLMALLQHLETLCVDLRVEMPSLCFEEAPLGDVKKSLVAKVREYERAAEDRRAEAEELQRKMTEVCKNLGRETKLLPEKPLPTVQELEDFRLTMERLESELMDREEKFFQMREDIVNIAKELEVPPSLDYEREILNMTNANVRVSDSEMEELETYHKKLLKLSRDVKKEIAELRDKIDDLWDKLETEMAFRNSFRQNNIGNSLTVLETLKKEFGRLEKVKLANIKLFVIRKREELEEMWQRCHCTERDKEEFSFFTSQCFTEDLLELHEREVERWKAYRKENKELFSALEEHKKLWEDFKGLEMNGGGKDRYKNRGGQLLIEEKLRNRLSKKIPKIEADLKRLAELFYQRTGRHFLTFGQTVQQYIDKLHEDHEKEFKETLSAKKQQRDQQQQSVLTTGRSRMNLFPSSMALNSVNPPMTPRSVTKRKVGTPATEPLKRLKRTPVSSAAKNCLPKVNVSKNRRSLKKRREQRRKNLSKKLSSSAASSDKENTFNYEAFMEDISTKKKCRSTAVGPKLDNSILAKQLPLTPNQACSSKQFDTPGKIRPIRNRRPPPKIVVDYLL